MNFSTPALDGSSSSSDVEDLEHLDNRRPCPLLKYRLIDVDPCDQHGSRNRCMSIVPNWLWRTVCRHDRRPVAPVQFPDRLVVSVRSDGVVVLKTSSPSSAISRCKSFPEVWLKRISPTHVSCGSSWYYYCGPIVEASGPSACPVI